MGKVGVGSKTISVGGSASVGAAFIETGVGVTCCSGGFSFLNGIITKVNKIRINARNKGTKTMISGMPNENRLRFLIALSFDN